MVIGLARVPPPPPIDRRRAPLGLDLPAVAWRLLCAFTLSIPFSIFIAQLLLILTTAAGITDWWARGRPPRLRTTLDAPMLSFLVVCLVAALHGLDPLESLWGCRTYLQMAIIYLVLGYADSEERCLTLARWFLVGAVITASYTVLAQIVPVRLPRLFLGSMTQSGQLLFAVSLALPLLLGRVFAPACLRPALALYVLALIVNLKRGVWLGTFAAVATIAWLASRRLLWTAAVIITLIVTLVAPVRTRITDSARDLFLPGNRYDIWLAAIDVVHRFPMGVGRKNGEILRDYPNIPQHHKHAHNTALQITLESGYLGLATFVWWMGRFGLLSWRLQRRLQAAGGAPYALAVAIFASFVGFHVAGLVEYNFGDSEVLEIFFVVMGLGLALERRTPHSG
jgi:O-Antigen ligase